MAELADALAGSSNKRRKLMLPGLDQITEDAVTWAKQHVEKRVRRFEA